MTQPIKLLLVNDDGIDAPGIVALIRELVKSPEKYEVRVVAPAFEHSAASHCITVHKPLRVRVHQYDSKKLKLHPLDSAHEDLDLEKMNEALHSVRAWSVEGTPADCVQFALMHLFNGDHKTEAKWDPDMVVSGINRGNNAGYNVIYSGTVAGAMEGSVIGFPAVALSLDHPKTYPSKSDRFPYHIAARLSIPVIDELYKRSNKLPKEVFWNVNIPNVDNVEDCKGVKLTKQGGSTFSEKFLVTEEVSETEFVFVRKGKLEDDGRSEEYDTTATRNGYIAVTPLSHYMDKIPEDTLRNLAGDSYFH